MFKDIFANLDFSAFQTYVDLGFLGIKKHVTGGRVFLPRKATKNKPVTAQQKEETQARIRVVVENAIAKIKVFFIFRVENRMKLKQKLDDAFEICASLANFKIKLLTINQ